MDIDFNISSLIDPIKLFAHDHYLIFTTIYFLSFTFVSSLAIPAAALFIFLAGVIYPFWPALFLVSFSSSIGATISFLLARFILRNILERKYAKTMNTVNKGIETDGLYYLFALRLSPIFPYFLVNWMMGLTKIKTWHFYTVTQIGMLPINLIYINGCIQLKNLESLTDILTPKIIISLSLMGIVPLILKKLGTFFT